MSPGKWLITLLLLAVAAGLLLLFRDAPTESRPPAPGKEIVISDQVKPVLKPWSEGDLEELQDWAEAQEAPTLREKKTLQFEALLAPGETLVTDVQEVSPGVFQFTQLTPEPGPEENLVLIKAQRHFVDLEGNVELLSAPSIILQSGSIGAISVFTDNSVYQIQMNVEEEDGATKLTGQVTSQQNAPSQVSDIDGSR